MWYLMKKPIKNEILSEAERQKLINEWNPEPLICEESDDNPKLKNRVVNGISGYYVTINDKECLNLATHNYLGLLENEELRKNATQLIYKYGVGSCGPRGFYGTLDVHLSLEDRLAKFMNTEAAVIYSYGFSTIASAIPAYCKRADVIFTDEMISFPAQKGIQASRSTVHYFKHNDMEDLERLLKIQEEKSKKNPKKAKKQRLFLIVEGIYFNTGSLCPLPKIIELRNKYKLRLFLDESQTFGVLGATGRGITEHFNIDRVTEVDLIVSSLESSIASTGGFCVGSHFIIEHQRLSGLGYCFSASSPPLLCQAAIEALNIIEKNPDILDNLRENCLYMHNQLKKIQSMSTNSNELSPIKHLYATSLENEKEANEFLDKLVQHCENNGFAITKSVYIESMETCKVPPSIRITVNSRLKKSDIDNFIDIVNKFNDKYFSASK
ncbi:serine palmitoyltransferase 1 [Chrysoperla carnea]|uniref:serine palmitoyltransferase 1 n=1 Tax=Chrysoperla carnea TaxID=189513 RepID=UPI001D05E72E|nr:serine palmitoyltransferase 1 [Chrysoperla carnea]